MFSIFTRVVKPLGNLLSLVMYESRNKKQVGRVFESNNKLVETPMRPKLEKFLEEVSCKNTQYLVGVANILCSFYEEILQECGEHGQGFTAKTLSRGGFWALHKKHFPLVKVFNQHDETVWEVGVIDRNHFVFVASLTKPECYNHVVMDLEVFKRLSGWELKKVVLLSPCRNDV